MLKALMIGWEFPPRISGGLGTACAGLVNALASRSDVALTLLLPDSDQVEPIPGVNIVSAAQLVGRRMWRQWAAPFDAYLPGSARPLAGSSTVKKVAEADRHPLSEEAVQEARLAALLLAVQKYSRAAALLATQNTNFDIVHCHDWLSLPAGLMVKRLLNIPLIVHIHSLETDRAGEFANYFIQGVEQQGMLKAEQVIAVSKYTRRRIIRDCGIPPEKVAVVHNAVDRCRLVDRLPAATRNKVLQVSFVGRVTWQKGPELFLHAARLVLSRWPDVHFTMAGDGELLPAMRGLADELGLHDKVTFTGFVPTDKVPALLDKTDVLVLSSHSEPFGLVALEAAARGVAVVLPSHAGAAEVLPAAERFPDGSAAELAVALETLLRNPKRRQLIQETNLAAAGNHTWERAAAEVSAFYQDLVSA
jgi:glycogen(starch) synthase